MVKNIVFCLVILSFLSCSTGHVDRYGQYVPKRPHYWLKNKIGGEIPKHLDTVNVYFSLGYFNYTGVFVNNPVDQYKIYKKYYSDGRVLTFGVDTKAGLNEKSLDPNFGSKGYYIYDKKKGVLKYEMFTNGNAGQYIILEYKLSVNRDTLTSENKGLKDVLVKEKIPKEWNKYKHDW